MIIKIYHHNHLQEPWVDSAIFWIEGVATPGISIGGLLGNHDGDNNDFNDEDGKSDDNDKYNDNDDDNGLFKSIAFWKYPYCSLLKFKKIYKESHFQLPKRAHSKSKFTP